MWSFTQTAEFDVLAERFGITAKSGINEELTARYNVAPSQKVPIITAKAKGGRLGMAKWRFRPPWINSGAIAPINARGRDSYHEPPVQRGRSRRTLPYSIDRLL